MIYPNFIFRIIYSHLKDGKTEYDNLFSYKTYSHIKDGKTEYDK